jgi:hypothetical protein
MQHSEIADARSCPEMQSDYHETLAKSATTFLARWNGGSVRVFELTVSLRGLVVVVFRDYAALRHENLRFAAEPLWMCGPFEWAPAALEVDVVAAAESPAAALTREERLLRLRDPIGFELLAPSLEVAENVKLR